MSKKIYVECPNCGNDVSVELVEHDKQIRADAIEECENHLIDSFGRANEYEMMSIGTTINTIVILFKQLKEQK